MLHLAAVEPGRVFRGSKADYSRNRGATPGSTGRKIERLNPH